MVGRRDYVYQTGVPTRWIGYEGARLSIEFAPSTPARRFAWGPGQDELLVQYEGSGTSDRRWYYADERGSTVAVADGSGNPTHKLAYDDYGNANVTTTGNPDLVRMRYTGQEWQAELGLYNYKSRLYAPGIGRFLQTDPIGTAGGVNLYAYVGGDPVNFSDPFGLYVDIGQCTGDLTCAKNDHGGSCPDGCSSSSCFGSGADLFGGEGGGGLNCGPPPPVTGTSDNITVTAARCSPDLDGIRNQTLKPGSYGTGEALTRRAATTLEHSQNKMCGINKGASLTAKLYIYAGAAAFAKISGTITDSATGRSYLFSSKIGVGGVVAAGVYDISGTIRSVNALDQGFSIAFIYGGYGGLDVGIAGIHSLGNNRQSLGDIDISSFLPVTPLGAADVGFKGGISREIMDRGNGGC